MSKLFIPDNSHASQTSERILTHPDIIPEDDEDTASKDDTKKKATAKVAPETTTLDVKASDSPKLKKRATKLTGEIIKNMLEVKGDANVEEQIINAYANSEHSGHVVEKLIFAEEEEDDKESTDGYDTDDEKKVHP